MGELSGELRTERGPILGAIKLFPDVVKLLGPVVRGLKRSATTSSRRTARLSGTSRLLSNLNNWLSSNIPSGNPSRPPLPRTFAISSLHGPPRGCKRPLRASELRNEFKNSEWRPVPGVSSRFFLPPASKVSSTPSTLSSWGRPCNRAVARSMVRSRSEFEDSSGGLSRFSETAYTASGIGIRGFLRAWFPCRLNCSSEAWVREYRRPGCSRPWPGRTRSSGHCKPAQLSARRIGHPWD